MPTYNAPVYTWLVSDGMHMQVGFLIDRLTALMMVVVTFVSLCVHVYTIGYMADDPGYQRFFSYISLFTFSMLMLVMANNFLQLFFGWEAVGVVSYLLIGFWYTRPSAIFANLKAFIVNRVGDFGFMLGIAGDRLLHQLARLPDGVRRGAAASPAQHCWSLSGTTWSALTLICICLFIGAMGKSAQVPLHVWLPDSMEGPTPISALIHAATMVTAGIFMVARMSPLFEYSDTALSFVLVIGATTAFFMGLLGIVNNDIKRVIAYSTLSQLGYMTVALGASAYGAAIFHLMTHAFFKALLFLAAGSVIIAHAPRAGHAQDGRARKYMPITAVTCWIGALALIGTPFFSGFYSKDAIIEAVRESHRWGAELRLLVRAARRVRHRALHLPHAVHDLPRPGALRACGGRAATMRRTHATAGHQDHDGHEPARSHAAREPLGGDRAARPARHSLGDHRLHSPSGRCSSATTSAARSSCPSTTTCSASWRTNFHGPARFALHGFHQAPFWLAAAGVAPRGCSSSSSPELRGGGRRSASRRSTRSSPTSTTSTGSTRTCSRRSPAGSGAVLEGGR